jgi:hypothetical protein
MSFTNPAVLLVRRVAVIQITPLSCYVCPALVVAMKTEQFVRFIYHD